MPGPSRPIRSGRPQLYHQFLDLDSDVFALAAHPTERLLAVGESSGRVGVWGWPEERLGSSLDVEEGSAPWFEKKWSTRRHKGSTRCVDFSGDGETLYSTGTDALLKAADSMTGRVTSKTWLPGTKSSNDLGSPATALLPLNPNHLIIGTDAATVHLLDLRTSTSKDNLPSAVVSTWKPDAPIDYISSLMALPPGAGSKTGLSYHFLGSGSGYLFHMDSRRPGKVLHLSEDQDDEILCTELVPIWPGSKRSNPKNEDGTVQEGKIVTGFSMGVLGVWNRGDYEAHQERINVGKTAVLQAAKKSKKMKATAGMAASGESVDCITVLPENFTPLVNALDDTQKKRQAGFWGANVAVGTGDGRVKVIRTGGNPGVIGIYEHFPISEKDREKAERKKKLIAAGLDTGNEAEEEEAPREAVLAIKVTSDSRLISGGGTTVTMFFGTNEDEEEEKEEEEEEAEEDGDDAPTGGTKRTRGEIDSDDSGDDSGSGWSDSDDSSSGKKKKDKKKKKKKGKKGARSQVQVKSVIGTFSGLD